MIVVPTAPWTHMLFDALAWSGGALVGAKLYRWRLQGLTADIARATGPGYFFALAAGAALGAWLSGSLNTLRDAIPSLSHSIIGALAGAIVGVELYKRWRGITLSTGAIFVGPFAFGAVIGRWGCLFAGLPDRTYGTATGLPWAVDLGDGIGRHPVQIYESLAMAAFLVVFLIGLGRGAPWATRRGFYLMCIWYGLQRFAWELLKPYPLLLGPLNIFHLLCLGLILYGGLFLILDLRREHSAALRRTGSGALSVPRADHEPL